MMMMMMRGYGSPHYQQSDGRVCYILCYISKYQGKFKSLSHNYLCSEAHAITTIIYCVIWGIMDDAMIRAKSMRMKHLGANFKSIKAVDDN